jgi:hypothetical protein
VPSTARRYGHGQSCLPACRGVGRICAGGKDAAVRGSRAIAAPQLGTSKAISFFFPFLSCSGKPDSVQRVARGFSLSTVQPRGPPETSLVQRARTRNQACFALRSFRPALAQTRVFFRALHVDGPLGADPPVL